MKIGNRIIGEGQPCFIIAEAGINHNGDFAIAKQLIDIAVDAKADCVKFQKRDLVSLYTPSMLANPNADSQGLHNMIEVLKQVELQEHHYRDLVDYCAKKGIMFLCTPWDKKSTDFLDSLGVLAFKVASADLTNIPLIKHIAGKGKPMIVSTGMSTEEEIEHTVSVLKKLGAQFALLHCNSTYPAPFRDINLRYMHVLKQRHSVPVGYSGHERGLAVSLAAVATGANIVERHFTLDRSMHGIDHAASLEPDELKQLVEHIRTIETALGQPVKRMSRGEILTRETLAKSIVAKVLIPKGTVITEDMLDVKGPGKGLSPQFLDCVINSVAMRDIPQDDLLNEDDLPEQSR
jgi:N-acetylneuraminate synthase